MEEIARVYARALFEAAKEHGILDEVREQLARFADALSTNRQFAMFCFSPYFSTEEKKEGLKRAVTDAEPIFSNFLQALVERHRMPAIFRISARYEDLWKEEHRLLPVEVTSAVRLDEDTIAGIGGRVGEQADRKVELSSRVDPEILGGIVLRVGNSILDASIRGRLNLLRKQVARAQ
jgi:F-type H+-transporting ATPase subunit delta